MTAQKSPKMWTGLVGVLVLIVVLIPAVSAQDMMYRYDAGHSGDYSPVAGVTGSNVSLLWSKTMEDQGNFFPAGGLTTPVIANGTVYATGIHGELLALDAATGRERWNASIFVYRSSPAVAKGIVYIGSNNGNVYALDEVTGKTIWTYLTRGPVDTAPTIANGTIYVTSAAGTYTKSDDALYALNATTGDKIWDFTIGGISDTAQYVETWGSFETSPAVAEGIVFVSGENGKIYALDKNSGQILWNMTVGGGSGWGLTPSPTVESGILYIGSNEGNNIDTALTFTIYAFNDTTGTQLWNFSGTGQITSDLTITKDILFINTDTRVYAVNAITGSQIWSTEPTETVIAAKDFVYFCNYSQIIVFDVDGTPQGTWTFSDNAFMGGYSTLAIENGILYREDYSSTYGNPAGFTPYYKNRVFALDLNAGPSGAPLQPVTPAPTASPSTTAVPANTPAPSTGIPLAIPGIALPAAIAIVHVLRQRAQHE